MHLAPGNILTATPLMNDPIFMQSQVLLNQESDEGLYGYILNRPLDLYLHNLDKDCKKQNIGIYNGGPVGLDEVGFVHNRHDLFSESKVLSATCCWGGYWDKLITYINKGTIINTEFKIFKGYCGWDIEQILDEMYNHKCWQISEYDYNIVFGIK